MVVLHTVGTKKQQQYIGNGVGNGFPSVGNDNAKIQQHPKKTEPNV